MKIDIVKKHENPLTKRTEIDFTIKDAQATPSRKEIREKMAALTGSDEKHLVIDVLDTGFGTTSLKGKARVYKTPEDLKKGELRYVVYRNFGKPEKPKAAEEAK